MTTTNMDIANTISAQLGRMTRMELGTKTLLALPAKDEVLGGLELHLGGASETRGKRVAITLKASDLYDVEVYRLRRGTYEKVTLDTVHGIYCDQLMHVVREMVFGARGRP